MIGAFLNDTEQRIILLSFIFPFDVLQSFVSVFEIRFLIQAYFHPFWKQLILQSLYNYCR